MKRDQNPPVDREARKGKNGAVETNGENRAAEAKSRKACLGLFQRREKWVLSWRGRLAALACVLVFCGGFILWVHPFLAVTDRLDSDYLVVEGWVPNYALEESIAEFKNGHYKMMFTVGADPLTGTNIEPGDSIAIEAYKRLKWLGMNPDQMKAVPAHIKYRNRTFQSAVALREWVEENRVPMTSFNVVTVGPHARRSRLLFAEAFEGRAKVGVISVENREYNPKRWWKYSEGVKEVIGEGVGYLYARFLFHPNE